MLLNLGKDIGAESRRGSLVSFRFLLCFAHFSGLFFISNLIPFFRGGSLQGPEAQNLCKKVLWIAAGSTVREILNMFSLLLIIVIL